MIDDQPTAEPDRVFALEQALDDMRSDGEATCQILHTILQWLGPEPITPAFISPTQRPVSRQPSPIHTNMTDPASLALPPPIPTPTASQKKTSLRPSVPPDFDGDCSKGKAFLTSCRTYIHLCPEAFDDEPTKIVWAMSYMKSG